VTETTTHLAARDSYATEARGAWREFIASFRGARIWRVLAWNDILARYRGSIIGPFWITLTQGAFILGVGLLYSQLFKISAKDYIPLLANGVIIWQLLASIILEGCDTFIQSSAIIKQTSLPMPTFLWRVVSRNLFIFAHQVVVLLVVAIWFHYVLQVQIWWAAIGLVLCVLNVSWMALILGIFCTRFRDVPQVVASAMQMLFFLTPVLWDPKQASPAAKALLSINPFYHMLSVTRDPLLGRTPHFESFGVLIVMAVLGWIAAFLIFAGVRRRVVHYL
jgi:ABC-type polysaccharide/polyol phosphate export permease